MESLDSVRPGPIWPIHTQTKVQRDIDCRDLPMWPRGMYGVHDKKVSGR